MELGEMAQKPGEWNNSLQSHRCPWTVSSHLCLCRASCVRGEAALSQQMWRSRAICLSALWLPGGMLQSLSCGQQPLLGKRAQRLRQSVSRQEMVSQMSQRGVWGLCGCLEEVTGFSHQLGPSPLLLSALGGAPSCSFICLASFSTACSQPAFCSACC